MSTGCSGATRAAFWKYERSVGSSYTIAIARPPRTYEGRTRTGYPMRAAMIAASSVLVAVPAGGCVMPSSRAIFSNRRRSSAISMDSGGVPRTRTPAASRRRVRRSGVCPPSWTTTPSGRSSVTISSTSSKVSGSKYSLSEMSKSVETVSGLELIMMVR